MLYKDSVFPLVTHSAKLNLNVELAIRYNFEKDARFFTDNSISAVEREFINVEEAKRWNLT